MGWGGDNGTVLCVMSAINERREERTSAKSKPARDRDVVIVVGVCSALFPKMMDGWMNGWMQRAEMAGEKSN